MRDPLELDLDGREFLSDLSRVCIPRAPAHSMCTSLLGTCLPTQRRLLAQSPPQTLLTLGIPSSILIQRLTILLQRLRDSWPSLEPKDLRQQLARLLYQFLHCAIEG